MFATFFTQDEYGDEREANMAAVVAAAKLWKDQDLVRIFINDF